MFDRERRVALEDRIGEFGLLGLKPEGVREVLAGGGYRLVVLVGQLAVQKRVDARALLD